LSLAGRDTEAFVDDAMREGAWGVVDDADIVADDGGRVAGAVGRSSGVLMLPASSAVVASDAAFLPIATAARRIVITDLARTWSGTQWEELTRRITRAAERNIAVYGTAIPSLQSQTDSSMPDALRSGGVMIATNTEATTIGRSTSSSAFGAFPDCSGLWCATST
jgi:hypothetical protein